MASVKEEIDERVKRYQEHYEECKEIPEEELREYLRYGLKRVPTNKAPKWVYKIF